MVDLPKQYMQLYTCFTPEMRRVLGHKLDVYKHLCSIDNVLKKLEAHVKNSSNEELQRKAFS